MSNISGEKFQLIARGTRVTAQVTPDNDNIVTEEEGGTCEQDENPERHDTKG